MTRTRRIIAAVLLFATVLAANPEAALAAGESKTYAYLPDHSVYFYDVSEGYAWANREVDALALAGIIKGGGDHLFRPGDSITRADFIVMLDRAYGMTEALNNGTITSAGTFSDIPKGAYYEQSVIAAKALGVATGTNGRFNPTGKMTRQDAMVFLKRTIDCTSIQLAAGPTSLFIDAKQIADYAQNAVGALASAQVVSGNGSKINPLSMVKRSEMAVMLYRALHLSTDGSSPIYKKRGDIINLCVGAQVYADVVIENYDPYAKYGELMQYTKMRQENGTIYVTFAGNQPINRAAVVNGDSITFKDASGKTETYPMAKDCVPIDVSPYHQVNNVVSTNGTYKYCFPSIVDGEVVTVYYQTK